MSDETARLAEPGHGGARRGGPARDEATVGHVRRVDEPRGRAGDGDPSRPSLPARLGGDARRWLRGHPLTVAIVALILLANVVLRVVDALAGLDLVARLATLRIDALGPLWPLRVPATLVVDQRVVAVVVHALAALVVLGVTETVLGWRRALVALLVTGTVGVGVGVGVVSLGMHLNELWALGAADELAAPVAVPLAGALFAASGLMGVFWRHRVRAIGYAAAVALLLFDAAPVDLYVLLAAVTGHALGAIWGRRRGVPLVTPRSSHREARVLLASLVAILAVGPVLTVFSPVSLGPLTPLGLLLTDTTANPARLQRCLDAAQQSSVAAGCLHQFTLGRVGSVGGVAVTVLPTLLMLVAAYGILRGRRAAAWLAIAVNAGLSALSMWYFLIGPYLVGDLDLPRHHRAAELTLTLAASALAPLVVAGLLVAGRRHLQLLASRRRVRAVTVTFLGTLLGASALYVAVGTWHPSGFSPEPTPLAVLADLPERLVPAGFLGLTAPGFLPVDPLAGVVYHWIGPVVWAVAIGCAIALLQVVPPRSERAARGRADRLLSLGGESLSFMATWPGNTWWFSAPGCSAIAYRVSHGIALTLGEPFGDPAEADRATLEFVRFCDDRALTPVFYSVHDRCRDLLVARGWRSQPVGLESVIDPRAWATRGKKWQDVRTAINRAAREGITDRLTTFPDCSLAVQLQIEAISEEWVGDKALPEMGFTLGGVDQLRDRRVRLLLAEDADGQVVAATSWLPTCRDGRVVGWTLDFMRRHPESPNGIMEFLIARMAERLRDEGEAEFMSLSAAPLAGLDPDDPAPLTRLLTVLSTVLEPLYGFHSLFLFKRKFQPTEREIHVVYPDASVLTAAGLAVAHAYVPDMRLDQLVNTIRRVEVPSR